VVSGRWAVGVKCNVLTLLTLQSDHNEETVYIDNCVTKWTRAITRKVRAGLSPTTSMHELTSHNEHGGRVVWC
jgi:hypothetical protein